MDSDFSIIMVCTFTCIIVDNHSAIQVFIVMKLVINDTVVSVGSPWFCGLKAMYKVLQVKVSSHNAQLFENY